MKNVIAFEKHEWIFILLTEKYVHNNERIYKKFHHCNINFVKLANQKKVGEKIFWKNFYT